ncbi:MAG: FAD-dependent oxidoreductase [Thermoleophilia bacterium]
MGEHDIVVVGAGTAGMPCAIEAALAGASVVVLEKADDVGGTLVLSAGQMSAAGARIGRERGIDDSPDRHYADVMALGHGKGDPALVRLAVDQAPHTIDWLEELGFPFPRDVPVIYHGHEAYSVPRTYWGRELGHSVLNVVRPRFLELVEAGRIELRLGTPLLDLVVEGGAVVGVRAEGPDGPVELRARSVVLATGGYAASRALFDERHPGVHCLIGGHPTSTGDGLLAAERVGAAFRGAEHHLPTAGCVETVVGTGRCEFWESLANLHPFYRKPREIHVNARGERFLREDCWSPDERERALVAQGDRMWIVFDAAAVDEDDPLVLGWSHEMLVERAEAGEKAWVADDPRTLAVRAGIDPGGLERTVAAYNEAVRAGVDALGREHLANELGTPPWFALLVESGTVMGFGGVAVDGELRVTDADGRPIAGLYAAGEILGAAALMGDAYCGGMGVTPAIGFGRLLGRRLARVELAAPAA